MRYAVLLEPIHEAGFEGFDDGYVHTLDLPTRGEGIEGINAAARDLAEVWIAEKRAYGEAPALALLRGE